MKRNNRNSDIIVQETSADIKPPSSVFNAMSIFAYMGEEFDDEKDIIV